jgi:cell division protein FtsL
MQNINSEDKKQNINPQEEKADLLRRTDIRTMQKDVMKLREIESQKEKERVAAIRIAGMDKIGKTQPVPPPPFQSQPVPKPPSAQVQNEKKEESSVYLIPKPPKRITQIQKVLVRMMVIVVVLLIIGFFYWYFFVKTSSQPKQEPVATTTEQIVIEEETTTEPIIPVVKEIVIYPALIKTIATETIEVASSSELVSLLPELMKKPFKLGFTRILIKNNTENRLLGLNDFFQAFGVKTPEGFFDKINTEGTLFIYAAKNQNRLGFVTETNDSAALSTLVLSWEKTIEKDMETLYSVLGKKGASTISYFRKTVYKNDSFRYVSFLPANFGICWSISNNYFIWTTSGESMPKAIDALIK